MTAHYIMSKMLFHIILFISIARCNLTANGAETIQGYQAAESELNAPRPRVTKVFWGKETNGVKAGLSVAYYSPDSFEYFKKEPGTIPIRCFPLLMYNNTNSGKLNSDTAVFDLPPLEGRCQLDLADDHGDSVKKTRKCEALGKVAPQVYRPSANPLTGITVDTGWRPYRYILVTNQARDLAPPLILQDYFRIANSGKYRLHFELCGFRVSGPGTNELQHFPPVDAEIQVTLPQ